MQRIDFPKVGMKDVMGVMWKGIRPQAWLFWIALFFNIAANIIGSVFIPLNYKQFFDILTTGTPESAAPILLSIVLAIFLYNAAQMLFRRLRDFCVSTLEANTMARLRQTAFNYLIRHSHGFFANSFTGSLVQRVSRLARSLERILDTLYFSVIPLLITVLSAVIVTYTIEPVFSYVIIGWVSIFFLLNFLFAVWRVRYNIQVATADSKTTGTLADIISNQSAVSLFAAFIEEENRVRTVTNDQARITRFTWNLGNAFDAVQAVLIIIAEFLLFYYGVQYWAAGIVTVGTLVLAQVYLIQISAQLWDFGRIVRTVYEVYADSKEMVEIMKLEHEVKDAIDAKDLAVSKGEVEFDSVSFNFKQSGDVLKNISLNIKGGEKVALVGPSGAGKTTFVRLLLRIYEVSSGRILIDGQEIQKATLDSLHRAVSLVPQEPVLFHRTLLENIRYGRPGASDEEVIEAARLAHCDEFIEVLPDKYETFVGERGVKLSGGERQRVAIARAILKNAPILILDEATSSLDSHSERMIQDALKNLMAGKTAIVIAHRLSTIRSMDRTVVIDQGQIIEDGTHEELLKKERGMYKKLWELQAGGFIAE